ncbi:hypothetical protein LA080_005307 [Diaporthe eres]|nr:hypothetical protein LA080_005307 [Diaporthe eres]
MIPPTVDPDAGHQQGIWLQTSAPAVQKYWIVYYWSPEPWPQPRVRTTKPYEASIASTSTPEAGSAVESGRRISPARKIPKRVRGEDLREREYRLSTPPRTPQLGRLGTPDLELTRKCDKFCDCCSDEHRYLEDSCLGSYAWVIRQKALDFWE